MVKNLPPNARDAVEAGLIPESGRCSGERNGTLLQYSCLGNPMDRGDRWATVHGVTKSRTRVSTGRNADIMTLRQLCCITDEASDILSLINN